MNQQARPQLRSSLRILDHLTQSYGWQVALKAMEGPALEVYDEIFLKGAIYESGSTTLQ